MKNFIKVFGIIALLAVIGFSMAACDDDGGGGGSGTLTITGIPSQYNGKFICGYYIPIYACENVRENAGYVVITASRISGGTVNIPMWEGTSAEGWKRYYGNDTKSMYLKIMNEGVTNLKIDWRDAIASKEIRVTFTNGGATVSWN